MPTALPEQRPIPATGPVDTSPISLTPAFADDLDPIWKAVVTETRTRSNDIHLPISLAYARPNALVCMLSIMPIR